MTEQIHAGRAIVLPASFPGSDEMSHCTVMFLGTAHTMGGTKDQVMNVLYDLQQVFGKGPMVFGTSGTDWFGVERNVPVMRLGSSWLGHFRKTAEQLIGLAGVRIQPSNWEYQPHVSLKDDDIELPPVVILHPPVLWWENERPVRESWYLDV